MGLFGRLDRTHGPPGVWTHGRWMAKDGVEGSKATRGEGWVPSPRYTAADRWECPPLRCVHMGII